MQRTYGWRSWGDPLREMLLGVALGCIITFIESGGQHQLQPLRTFLRNSIFGIIIVFASRGLETMLSWAIEQSRIPTVFRTIVYTVGSWLGFFVGLAINSRLFGPDDDGRDFHSFHFFYSIATAAAASVIIGLILHHNRKRNDRLRASIERLKEHEFAEKELEIAREMQQRLLPPPEIAGDGWRVSARTEAAHIIGGDFYDVLRLEDGSVAFVCADVSGKGIAASLIMASCKAMIPFLATRGGAAVVMNALNEKLSAELQRREFVAMTYAQLDPKSGRLDIVNAGMPDPLLLDGSCRAVTFTGDRFPLGARASARYEATSINLGAQERLLLFSDGLPEATTLGEPLGYDRIESLAARMNGVDDLMRAVQSIDGVSIDDDATVVLISRSV
jgi:serine phosphatase RsbU (regulator of sigma subunit)